MFGSTTKAVVCKPSCSYDVVTTLYAVLVPKKITFPKTDFRILMASFPPPYGGGFAGGPPPAAYNSGGFGGMGGGFPPANPAAYGGLQFGQNQFMPPTHFAAAMPPPPAAATGAAPAAPLKVRR